MSAERRRAWHPLALAAYPVLHLYAANAAETPLGNVLGPLGLAVGAAAGLWVIGTFLLEDHRRSALAVSALALLFFSFGHVTGLLGGSEASVSLRRALLALWLAAAVGVVMAAVRTRRRLGALTRTANLTSSILVVVAMVALVGERGLAFLPFRNSPALAGAGSWSGEGPPRDIFYLVFDRYGSLDALEDAHGVDNRDFQDWLRAHGFFVADHSFSNYLKTGQSLGSSLSMEYLDELAAALGPDSGDWLPTYERLADNPVAALLQQRGYRYVHVGSWWSPTTANPNADLNFTYEQRNEFASVLLRTTALPTLLEMFGGEVEIDDRELHYRASGYQLDVLENLARETRRSPAPSFVFAHVLLPHPPYVFDEDGSYVAQEQGTFEDQLAYLNARIRMLVDELLAGPDDEDPIVLIQADEGPFPYRYAVDVEGFDWRQATDRELQVKMGILNAYYLPGNGDPDPYPFITPVNSFRLVLSRYFDDELPLLPDRSFAFVNEAHLYQFFEVTDRLDPAVPSS